MTTTTCRSYILDQAKSINHAFGYRDLPKFGYGTKRNEISKLRKEGEILKLPKECPARFILTGWKERLEYRRWFQNDTTPMRGGKKVFIKGCELRVDFASFVESLDWEKLAYVHDVRVEFDAVRVEGVSSGAGWVWSFKSHSWHRKFQDLEFPLAVQVYDTGRIQIVVKCSLKPIPFDFKGLTRLTAVLGELKGQLGWKNIPNVVDWIVTSWHYGKDSLNEVSGASLNVTFVTWSNTLARIYAKSELKKVRVEKIQSPRKPVQELFEEIIGKEETA